VKRRLALALAATVAAVLALSVATASAAPYVVVYKPSVESPGAVTAKLQARVGFRARHRYHAALRGFSAELGDRQLRELRASGEVDIVQRDAVHRAAGSAALAAGETVPPGIRRIGAATTTEAGTPADGAIAVLDTGVDLPNRDLNAVSGVNCVNSGTAAQDDNGHGTNVAGIAAGRNAGAGVVGVAPGTRIVSVKVLNARSSGTLSQILCGIDWVTANAAALNIRVANMSVAGSGTNDGNCGNTNGDAEHRAICRSTAAGVTYVVAAGNAKTNFAKTIPAAYPEVLTTTAITDTDGLPGRGTAPKCKAGEADDRYGSYSNYPVGDPALAHTVAAPGTCVVSDAIGGGTSTYYGTSQAAPHVAGTVARCITAGPCAGLAPAAVIARVRADAQAHATLANGFAGDPLSPVKGKVFGYLAYAGGY